MKFHQAPVTFVQQVHLFVTNIERSLAFYKDVLGFQILRREEKKVILSADEQTPLFIIEEPAQAAPRQGRTTGLYHVAFLLPTRADLAHILVHLLHTYPLQGASDHLVSEALYLADPDGNGIEIYIDRDANAWKWTNKQVHMTTQRLDAENVLQEATSEWKGMPKGTIIGHIHLQVSDLQEAEEFYTRLGLEVVSRYSDAAIFVSSGGYHHHIGLNTWQSAGAPAPLPNSAGLHWFSLMLPNEETRAQVIARLHKIGANVKKEGDIVITTDPAGNTIHLVI
ncbi:VOC family protein [Ectobacillus sp. JY-23]|uniref:VOC family protein n=1 Tax=Ectobacillus sp. JY-23 TaxID=2933872 RepID=UPI001FF3DCD4|nr:VOC family protein [Ectobacillus sp. JY-23]UOY93002.1 VOC family protein [Ectobacillus sp. JY-23]